MGLRLACFALVFGLLNALPARAQHVGQSHLPVFLPLDDVGPRNTEGLLFFAGLGAAVFALGLYLATLKVEGDGSCNLIFGAFLMLLGVLMLAWTGYAFWNAL